MGSDQHELTGPDLTQGVELGTLEEHKPLLGHAHGEAVLLVKQGDEVFAVGATCSHYGGPLAEGIVVDGTVRCPWHHACFDLRSGRGRGPGLSPIACFDVTRDGGLVKLGAKREPAITAVSKASRAVVIVGTGPAGTACAETLRQLGYSGKITLLGDDEPGALDRPNLSKDYLAGAAPEEWVYLRQVDAFAALAIDLITGDPAVELDVPERSLKLRSGRVLTYGTLVLATGAAPIRLALPGANLPHVFTLRTLTDSRSIIERLGSAKRAAIIGASFIGLETAASLRKRGLHVSVIGPESVPLERVLGAEVGSFVRSVHEENGVHFHLGRRPASITEESVTLDDGTRVPADLVVMGVGVRPRTELAERAKLKVDRGIIVDAELRTSAQDVYAAGDVARFPYGDELVRIEHWAVAMRQGQAIARTLVGNGGPFRDVPFFWSQHHDVVINYVGHAERYDAVEIRGNLAARDAAVFYREGRRIRAVATVGRDEMSLRAELAFERQDPLALEELLS